MLKNKKHKEVFWAYLFIAPTSIGLLVLNIIPAFETIVLSFKKSTGFSNTVWTGFDNYKRLFQDQEVLQSIWNTVKYSIWSIPLIVVFSLFFAVMVNKKIKGISVYRTLYFLPVVAAPTAVAMIWKWLFNSEYGLINNIIMKVGLESQNWLTNPDLGIYTVIIVGVWSSIGYNMILILAGLQEIPNDYYESASIDGAGPYRTFFSITLPLLSPTLFFVVITTIISSLQVFDSIFMMIKIDSEVMYKTQSLTYLFYKHSFLLNDKGYGSAIVVVLLILIGIITLIQMKLQKKWVNY